MKTRHALPVVFLCCSVVGLLFQSPAFAQPNEDFGIYVFNIKTGVTQQVTGILDAGEYNPSFSTNGKFIVHDVKVEIPFSHDLFVTKISTGISTPLAGADGGNDAAWSRNGRLIAFDRAPVEDSTLYLVPASGGTRVPVRADAVDPHWSPNSKFLVFTDVTDNSLRTINLKSGIENTIAPLGINPAWSTNGKYVAFSDSTNLFTIQVNNSGAAVGSPVQLTSDGPGVFNQQPTWFKNGKTLAFHSNRGGSDFDIWTIPPSGGTPALLTGRVGAGDFDPAASIGGGGHLIAYSAVGPPLPPAAAFGPPSVKTLRAGSYPNPFNPTTTLTFALPEDGHTTVRVYDMLGKEVAVLIDGQLSSGTHAVTWDAQNLPSGTYLYRIESGTFRAVRRIVLLK